MSIKRVLAAFLLSIAFGFIWTVTFPNSLLASFSQKIAGVTVAIASLSNGQVLLYDGTSWVNSTVGTNSQKPGNTKITSGSVLTINDGCNAGDPCNVRVGSTTYSLTTSATATITAGSGSGTAKVFITSAGVVTVQHPSAAMITVTCNNCTQAAVANPAFPANSVPLYNVTITSGAWTAVADLRSFIGGGIGVGSMVLLETQVAAASATLDFSCISSSYDEFFFSYNQLIVGTDGARVLMRVSDDNGSTYEATSYSWNYYIARTGAAGPAGSDSDTSINLSGDIDAASTRGGSGSFTLFSPTSTALYKEILGQFKFLENTSGFRLIGTVGGAWESTNAVTNVRLLPSSGTFTTGIAKCFGVAQ